MSDRTFSTATLLAWAIAAYSIIIGILGIMAWDSGSSRLGRDVASFFGQENSPATLVFAILYIVTGAIMLVASLGVLKPNLSSVAIVLVVIFWLVRGFFALFIEQKAFKPTTLGWCKDLAFYLVVALAAWQTKPIRS